MITPAVLDAVRTAPLPAYVYDLGHLDAHVRALTSAFDDPRIEVLHAVKANPDAELLRVIARHVDGLEVASGGELAHVRSLLPHVPLAFGGPGKTDDELRAALSTVDRFHVESHYELRRLSAFAVSAGVVARVLLRVNLPVPGTGGAALTMGGVPSPFGMDPAEAARAASDDLPGVEIVGVHAHLASGLDAPACAALASSVLRWAVDFGAAQGIRLREVNVGGGMGVDYGDPSRLFDWGSYARRLSALVPSGVTVRVEPGRAVSVYSGWYATRVLDVKHSHGGVFAVCAGGTHHLRTPVTKGHDQPLVVLPFDASCGGPSVVGAPVTFVGQLCTPKDVFARGVWVERVSVGDLVVFAMAGAYAYNISHRDFLMHPCPGVVHV
ncbi:diaminopimelate decarboxylase [Herbihabitans rhizosphaerae]|uniref:Diaminopimelate decarboxylase n=1 Tax=Herbihabitans rhizosphaerae TaxID=1872711 RepID=A0A4Q7KV26_9PSEU|nr:type III PLP-dependent enzyme [Herbihabitans rhizosphaerae]RZS40858.1 diaminopimelate decarboxylase [Herbihabitans rhizosphaerae]